MKETDNGVTNEEGTDHTASSMPSCVNKIYFSAFVDRGLKLSLPFILCAIYLLFLKYIYVPDDFYQISGLMLFYFLPPAGKETIIPVGIASGYSWYLMAISVTLLDVLSCMFMIWNFELVCKMPVFGGWTSACMKAGKKLIQKFPWIESLSSIGLGIFVLLPFQGSGGIASSVLGKILGISSWYLFLAISIGSFIGSSVIALGFYSIEYFFNPDSTLIIMCVVIIAVIGLAYRYVSQRKRTKMCTEISEN